jgi:uncharacterized protein (DUF2147 family)
MAADIDGRWLTFDSDSGAKRSIVEIVNASDVFRGQIVELFSRPGEPSEPVCDQCPGVQHGKRILGMEILLLNAASNGSYAGKVLDPEEGRFYKCIVTLDVGRKRLSIRGYVGTPLIGRTVVWERVEEHASGRYDRRDGAK